MRRSGTRVEATGEDSRSSLTSVPEESSPLVSAQTSPTGSELLNDAELDAMEDELARAERTLGLLADANVDPAAATSWLVER